MSPPRVSVVLRKRQLIDSSEIVGGFMYKCYVFQNFGKSLMIPARRSSLMALDRRASTPPTSSIKGFRKVSKCFDQYSSVCSSLDFENGMMTKTCLFSGNRLSNAENSLIQTFR